MTPVDPLIHDDDLPALDDDDLHVVILLGPFRSHVQRSFERGPQLGKLPACSTTVMTALD